jgi:hypothetical protein
VGIGKASPGYKLVVAAATGNVMQFENTSDSDRGGRITNTGTAGTGKFGITTTSSGYGLSFGIDAVEQMLLDTSNNLNITSGNVVMATSGKGIDFSATTSGSGTMTSELLNDYEEGTWTPVLATDNVTFTSVGYTIQVGKYTKVGNLVTVTGTIQTNSVVIGSAAGNVWITGLPFTQPSTDAPGGVNCFVAQSWAVDAPLAGYVFDSKIYLVERATSVSSSSLVSVADVATGGSNNLVRFSGHYYV